MNVCIERSQNFTNNNKLLLITMSEDIKNYVKKCPICEKMKITTNVEVPLQISSMGETLFDHTFIDFVGPISPTKKKFKFKKRIYNGL